MLFEMNGLNVVFDHVHIVKNVSFKLAHAETVGIVGESGCGKSTMLQALLKLDDRAQVSCERLLFEGMNLEALAENSWRDIRGSKIAMIYQNALDSMNPMKKIGYHFYETVNVHNKKISKPQIRARAEELMKSMNLSDTHRIFHSYPHELSGGMCQRIAVAIAMMNNPSLLLADEPTSALDVTSQAELVKVMVRLKAEFEMSMIIVTHNIGVIAQVADKVGVMYGGRIVEWGTAEEILKTPAHPYTQALLESVPKLDGTISEGIEGKPPEFATLGEGCSFAPRCKTAAAGCSRDAGKKIDLSDTHWVVCNKCKG